MISLIKANSKTLWMPSQASTIASDIDALFYFIYWCVIFFFGIVVVGTLYFSYKYRDIKKKGLTTSLDHNNLLEITWTLIPTLLSMVVFFWGANTFINMSIVPHGAMEVYTTAKAWNWEFEYQEGVKSKKNLVVPVNTPVKIILTSKDFLHSFYVPDFRTKMDAIPNRYTVTWFEATQLGEYDLLCTEYCGTGHSKMLGKVIVLSQSNYDDWIAEESSKDKGKIFQENPVLFGEQVYYENACNTCHSLDGSVVTGPSFKNIFGKTETMKDGSKIIVNEEYIRESILNPKAKIVSGYQPVMPPYPDLEDIEVRALIEFIKSKK